MAQSETDTDRAERDRHAAKMAKKKAARDKIMATKSGEKGLVIVLTGAGKGKSSSGFGMILRASPMACPARSCSSSRARGTPASGGSSPSISPSLCQFHAMGEGFTWETQDKERDIAAARAGWEKAKELIRDPEIRLVLLDEINIALRYGYLPLDEVLEFLAEEKPPMTHVVLTGRNAAEGLIEAADLVTEMTLVKHPFRSGIKAQPGVEF